MSLFQQGFFVLHSGDKSKWKIECDALGLEDWDALAVIAAERLPIFRYVEGVPRGGVPFARALAQHASPDATLLLIVDDVYTTGRSMERFRGDRDALGCVVFARNPVLQDWIVPLFRLTPTVPMPKPRS